MIVLISALTAFLYFRGWIWLRRSSPVLFPVWRLVAFLSGLLVILLAVSSPLGVLDHQLLTAHMVKHLLLMVVGAPLILFGTGQPILRELPNWFTHTIEDLSFICAGLLFWKPIITRQANGANTAQWLLVVYLFLATVPCDILSAFLAFCGRVLYPHYLSSSQTFSLSALQDQECAGALMWVTVTFAYLIPAVLITANILSTDGVHFQKGPIASRGTIAAEMKTTA